MPCRPAPPRRPAELGSLFAPGPAGRLRRRAARVQRPAHTAGGLRRPTPTARVVLACLPAAHPAAQWKGWQQHRVSVRPLALGRHVRSHQGAPPRSGAEVHACTGGPCPGERVQAATARSWGNSKREPEQARHARLGAPEPTEAVCMHSCGVGPPEAQRPAEAGSPAGRHRLDGLPCQGAGVWQQAGRDVLAPRGRGIQTAACGGGAARGRRQPGAGHTDPHPSAAARQGGCGHVSLAVHEQGERRAACGFEAHGPATAGGGRRGEGCARRAAAAAAAPDRRRGGWIGAGGGRAGRAPDSSL